jgi:integrase
LKQAIEDGWLKNLPTQNLRPLKVTTVKRDRVEHAQIENLCSAAFNLKIDQSPVTKNAQQFADYIRVLAYSGARRSETLRLKWGDVSFKQKQLTIGSDGLSKNRQSRVVDFNPALERQLKNMFARRAPDSVWIFPSPQRGEKDIHAKTFMESLRASRTEVRMEKFGFHDCRHFFISMCVMSGIDYMTIARWVGHKDGGVLIGKVYGHLSDEHAKKQSHKLKFS